LALAATKFPSAEAAVANPVDPTIRLSLNENAFGPSPRALTAIRNELVRAWRYSGDEVAQLESKIAAREGVSPDQIVIGEILDALGLHLALDGGPGGEFIYSEPGYTALVDAVAPGGGVVVGVPLNNRLENDLTAIAAKINARTRAVYLVNPHNPSGTVSETEAFKAFVHDAAKRTTVIVDEAYLEFTPDFGERSVIDLRRAGDNVVVFRTFAKIYGLAGLSIGYAVAPKKLAEGLKRKGIGLPHALDRLAVAAASASLDDEGFVPATRLKVAAEREKWRLFFDEHGIRHADARGNFVFFETGRPHATVAAALRARGVEIARAFEPLDTWVRITIGLPHENDEVRRAVAAILNNR
jgi:Histidinol-phosphate/aromatic aminotransferase and cobyric acid decarboxylase